MTTTDTDRLPASVRAKVLLRDEMEAQGIRPAELARRMGTTRQDVNRILSLEHTTKIDTVQDALAALGKELVIKVARAQRGAA